MEEGADYVAKNYAWETAGYFWEMNGINAVIFDSISIGDEEFLVLRKVSNAVYFGHPYEGKTPDGWSDRQKRYDEIRKILSPQ